jgi:hypothetical protein
LYILYIYIHHWINSLIRAFYIVLVVSQSNTIREIKKLFRKQLERKEAQDRGTISW